MCIYTSWIPAESQRWRWRWLVNSTGLSGIVWEMLLERRDRMSACFVGFTGRPGRASSSNISFKIFLEALGCAFAFGMKPNRVRAAPRDTSQDPLPWRGVAAG